MGERGPLPLPYARRRNKREIRGHAAVGRPSMPRDLPDEAKAEWKRVVPDLEQMGTLTQIDRSVLIRYCVAWADWMEVQDMLRKSGKLIKGQKGNAVRNPLLIVRNDLEATLSDLGKQLGLSPGARLRAGIAHQLPAGDGQLVGPGLVHVYFGVSPPADADKRLALQEPYIIIDDGHPLPVPRVIEDEEE